MKLRALLLLLSTAVTGLAAPGVPFVDEFDKAAHDWNSDSPAWIVKVKDGRLICENLNPNAGYLTWAARELPLEKNSDFEISTRVKMVEGAPDGYAAIIWDAGENTRRIFEISTNGKYGIYGFANGAWYYTHVNVPSQLILKAADNDLAIRRVGGRVYFFINGSAVDAIDYADPVAPWVGLVTPAGCTNSFDRFEVRYLTDSAEQRAAAALKCESDVRASLIASGPPLQDFVEKFDDNSHAWEAISVSDTWSAKIAGGVLEWTNKKTTNNKQRSFIKVPVNEAADYDLSFRARHVAGAENVFVGLAWSWPADHMSCHEFGFAAEGSYLYGSSENGTYDNAVPWTQSSLLRKDDFNELRARKLGRTLFLFINGQVVADTPAKLIQGEFISIVVSQGTTVAYDDIRVSYPKLSEQETAAETEKITAALKAGHGKPGLGVVYSVAHQRDINSAQAKADMQRIEDERWKLTDADFKLLTKARKQFEGKKMLSLFGSWGRPVSTSSDGSRVYYNYKLVGRTQYYYEFIILKRGKQEEWVIDQVQQVDKRW